MARGYLTPWRRGSLTGGGSLFDLHRQMNRLFDDLFEHEGGGTGLTAQTGMTAPALEVHQDENRLEITAELPGVRQEDIDLTVEDGVLTLRGEKQSSRRDEERGYSERSYGSFERRITLPADVDEEQCSADFRDGVLTITLPRSAHKQRGRRIPLGSGGTGGGQRLEAQNDSEGAPRQQAAEEPTSYGGQSRQQG